MSDPNTVDPLAIPTPPQPMASVKPKRAVVMALIDETGSMASIRTETIAGVNAFFRTLQETLAPDEAYVGALLFDKFVKQPVVRPLFTSCTIGAWQPMTEDQYNPRGYTPLYDAIAMAVAQAEHMVNTCKRDDGEDRRVVLVIQTDGAENSSTETTHAQVTKLLADKQALGWEVLFIGADLADTDKIGASIGTMSANTMAYDTKKSAPMFAASAANIASFTRGQSVGAAYSVGQRNEFEQKSKG